MHEIQIWYTNRRKEKFMRGVWSNLTYSMESIFLAVLLQGIYLFYLHFLKIHLCTNEKKSNAYNVYLMYI